MTRKYEFTGETRGSLRRIRRLSDGCLGGWIENEKNLSHIGAAWVWDNAQVYGAAWVCGEAQVYGNAQVYGDARVFGDARVYGEALVCGTALLTQPLKIATRSDGYTFTVFPCMDNVWRLTAGCHFFTLEEAWQHWKRTRVGTPLGEETFDILVMFEHHIEHQKQKGRPVLPQYDIHEENRA